MNRKEFCSRDCYYLVSDSEQIVVVVLESPTIVQEPVRSCIVTSKGAAIFDHVDLILVWAVGVLRRGRTDLDKMQGELGKAKGMASNRDKNLANLD